MSPLLQALARMIIGVAALGCATPAWTQDYPSRPIRMVVPYAPGGASDVIARAIGQKMDPALRQPVVIENRPGANSVIGTSAVLAAARDGYTMLLANAAVMTSTFVKSPPFDSLKDLEPVIAILGASYGVIINAGLPARNLREFLAYAKANPGKLNGAASTASSMLFLEMFKSVAGVDVVRIDYKGSAPAITALVANEVQLMLDNPVPFRQHLDSGKLRLLGVASRNRIEALPDVPTLSEQGLHGFDEAKPTTGFWLATGSPAPAVSKLNAVIDEAIKTPDILARIAALGAYPVGGKPETLRELAHGEAAFWANAAKVANFKPD